MKLISILDMNRETFFIKVTPALMTLDMGKWLEEHDGAGYSVGGWGIYFYDSRDATMFALRWA